MFHRREFLKLSAGTTLAAGVGPAFAQQNYPERPIRILIGFPAGSGADILGRYFAAKLGETSGQSVIIENKPGANSNIAVGMVANAKPDGYTALFVANSNMAGSRFLFKDLPFDTVKDFVPAASFAQIAFVVVVGAKSPIKDVAELTAHLKGKKQATFGVTNQMAIISTEYYRQAVGGFDATLVQYRTAPEALPDVENGTLDFMIMDGTFAAGAIRQGKIKPLAVTTAKRHPMIDAPTMQEAGIKDFELAPWWGVYFPKGTPEPIVKKMSEWMNKIASTPDAAKFLENVGSFPLVEDGPAAAARLQADIKLWAPIVAAAKIEPQ